MDVPFVSLSRAISIREILIEVLAEVSAPYEMASQTAMGKTNDIVGFIGE